MCLTIYLLKQARCQRMWHYQEVMMVRTKLSEVNHHTASSTRNRLLLDRSEYLFIFEALSSRCPVVIVILFLFSVDVFNIGVVYQPGKSRSKTCEAMHSQQTEAKITYSDHVWCYFLSFPLNVT